MSKEPQTTPQEEELIRNIVRVAFGGEFLKMQDDMINLGNHVLKLQERVTRLEKQLLEIPPKNWPVNMVN